jgi:hypothetical protein
MCDLQMHAASKCGYATLHHVVTKEQEDRMESFFLSETLKYLYVVVVLALEACFARGVVRAHKPHLPHIILGLLPSSPTRGSCSHSPISRRPHDVAHEHRYLLFDAGNILHTKAWNHIFTTQGHIIPGSTIYRDASLLQLGADDTPKFASSNRTGRSVPQCYNGPNALKRGEVAALVKQVGLQFK